MKSKPKHGAPYSARASLCIYALVFGIFGAANAVGDEHFEIARRLLVRYGSERSLRTLDELQLSVAVGLRRAGFPPIFVASDLRLYEVAELEGPRVTNPEHPTLTL